MKEKRRIEREREKMKDIILKFVVFIYRKYYDIY